MLTPPYSNPGSDGRLHVAIIGGGITGVTLALGLEARGVSYTLYERAPEFKEMGAGVGFSPNAEAALESIDPAVRAAYKRVAMANGEDYFQWVDGFDSNEVIYKLYLGEQAFQGCRRSDFLDEMVKLIPKEKIRLGKAVEGIDELKDGRLRIQFRDGAKGVADIVIGCDGIHSRVRRLLLEDDNRVSHASYSNQFCFRALVPMDEARKTLSEYRASTRFMYNGPNAHAITYPVSEKQLNVLLVLSDPDSWQTEDGRHTARGLKNEALEAFRDWHPALKAIIALLPEQMDKWAIFDMLENPAPFYSKGSVCIAGDAAHAVGPHLGAGAGFGMEDALVLAELLQALDGDAGVKSVKSRAEMGRDALKVYNDVRYERTQWLVKRTREACDLFQWKDPDVGSDSDKFGEEITWRFRQIWNYDVDAMATEAVSSFRKIANVAEGEQL
ncbi:putative Salicylate hydroxylase [Seiridium cardinale]